MRYRCSEDICGVCWDDLVDREFVDTWTPQCPECGASGIKLIGAPMVLKASYPDGMRRKSAGWKDLREAASLEAAADKLASARKAGDVNAIKEERAIRAEAKSINNNAKSIKIHE
jgi:hypothetical protein